MKNILLPLALLCIFQTSSYSQSHSIEIAKFQKTLNDEYSSPKDSPLSKKERKKFKGHNFFPIDEKYKVEAKFKRAKNAVPFQMKTSSKARPTYEVYGTVSFELDGKKYKLNIYQSHKLRATAEYKNYLFIPFTDLTSGKESYGGGRYIELSIPKGKTIIIDFNKAYAPYCAYTDGYSCPIPPRENHLKVRIEAGVMNLKL